MNYNKIYNGMSNMNNKLQEEIEKIIDKYKSYIIEEIMDKIGSIEGISEIDEIKSKYSFPIKKGKNYTYIDSGENYMSSSTVYIYDIEKTTASSYGQDIYKITYAPFYGGSKKHLYLTLGEIKSKFKPVMDIYN